MNESENTNPQDTPHPREALRDSERKAAEPQPESFNDGSIEEKIVEIGPITEEGDAIKGLDPK